MSFISSFATKSLTVVQKWLEKSTIDTTTPASMANSTIEVSMANDTVNTTPAPMTTHAPSSFLSMPRQDTTQDKTQECELFTENPPVFGSDEPLRDEQGISFKLTGLESPIPFQESLGIPQIGLRGEKVYHASAVENGYVNSVNGFIAACLEAYNHHYHLVIDPNDVWIAILNILQIYIDKNAEKLRSRFVSHEGQKELKVYVNATFRTLPVDDLCSLFAEEIEKNFKEPEFVKWVKPGFSTTKSIHETISTMMLMSSTQKYFSYSCICCCGIPSVTMTGTVSDWELLLEKAKEIEKYDCGDGEMVIWSKMLLPILEKFVESANGNVDDDWWGRICKRIRLGSGGESGLNGWLAVFTAYSKQKYFEGKDLDFYKPVEEKRNPNTICYYSDDQRIEKESPWPTVLWNDICLGYCEVPMKVIDIDETEYKTTIVAGHTGMICNGKTVKPCPTWRIIEEQPTQKSQFLD